jgi:hypothetical protein
MDIPVYLFTGFLESGKTKFIQETMEDTRFDTGEKTLLLVCEEGVEEYDTSKFCSDKIYIETIEEEEDLGTALLSSLIKKHSAKRVLVEYNGMWKLQSLFAAMPKSWIIAQEFLFVDANTIINYNNNMRNLVADKLSSPELVVFNRYSPEIDKMELHKLVRGLNTKCAIAYEFWDGHVEYDDIEDPLPFDRDAEIIKIEDKDYAYFYRNLSEDLEFYNGKTVKFKCVVAKNKQLKDNQLVIGRHVMTCCVEDISFAGFLLIGESFKAIENRDWCMVTATVKLEFNEVYGKVGPVLYMKDIARTSLPEEEVATFY